MTKTVKCISLLLLPVVSQSSQGLSVVSPHQSSPKPFLNCVAIFEWLSQCPSQIIHFTFFVVQMNID